MELKCKYFNELTSVELYEILRARAEIFVVEQNCVYQDLDRIDYESLHLFYEEKENVTAYARAFWKNKQEKVVQLGRVLTLVHGKGLGRKLLQGSIKAVQERFSPDRIYIEAQCYVTGFYEQEGFRICSEEFLEDGIPHVEMELQVH